ncbi:S-adenosylmethionine decarboxylase family protein [Micromonospora sp. WMMD723]|uniref:S-adenosylmethionine decarboxylase family protein n=1 Tax=Micromonospora sp. WMMD723 TaxID=3403465 RepID=UPI003CF1AC7B
MIHAVYDVTNCARADVDPGQIMTAMRETCRLLGNTARSELIEPFQPHGATCVLILAESHITVSTWPELGLAHIDVFTCRAESDPDMAIAPILALLGGDVALNGRVPRLPLPAPIAA